MRVSSPFMNSLVALIVLVPPDRPCSKTRRVVPILVPVVGFVKEDSGP